jgi:hypothetical protein
MPDLDELLRDEFHAVVAGLARTPELDARVAGHVRRARLRQRRAARLAALALVVAAVAPVAWLASRGSGTGDSDVSAGSQADGLSPDDPSLAGVTYLVPDSLPDGLQLQLVAGGLRPGVRTWDRYQWIDVVDGAGGVTGRLVVRERKLLPGDPDPLALLGRSGTPTTIGDLQAVEAPTGEWLAWVDPEGVFHLLTRPDTDPGVYPYVAALELRAVADGSIPVQPLLVPAPENLPGDPPGLGDLGAALTPGLHVVDAVPAGSGDANPRAMWFSDGEGRELTISVADASIPPIRPALEDGRVVRVRDRDAVLAPTTASRYDPLVVGLIPAPDWSADHDPPTALTWMESDGVAVTLVGRGLSDDELVEVARDLRRVDAMTWASYLDRARPPQEPEEAPVVPPTTVAAPMASTVPAGADVTLPPPPPGAEHLVGASVGSERWHETTGRCPTLDHELDEVVTMADGTVWHFVARYCGELSDSMNEWRGGGDITLTAPSGATITLTFSHDWLRIPSGGVPYVASITGGTGAYAGATGACLVDESITMGVFAVNGNSFHQGTVTCDVAV